MYTHSSMLVSTVSSRWIDCSAEAKNEWRYTSSAPYVSMVGLISARNKYTF
jgi:hypothetical protein